MWRERAQRKRREQLHKGAIISTPMIRPKGWA